MGFLEAEEVNMTCAGCSVQKKGLKQFPLKSPFIVNKGYDVLFVLEDHESKDLTKYFEYFMEKYFKKYSIVCGLSCSVKGNVPPSPVYNVYKTCNVLSDEFTSKFKVIVTVGNAINAITKTADLSTYNDFNEILFNPTYFYTGYTTSKKVRVYPIPKIVEWSNRDNFENFFVKEQIKFIRTFLDNYSEFTLEPHNIEVITGKEHLLQVIADHEASPYLSWDSETNSLNTFQDDFKIGCLTFTYDGITGYFYRFSPEDKRLIAKLFQGKILITANGKYDLRSLCCVGMNQKRIDEDVTLLFHLLNTERSSNRLKSLAWLIGYGGFDIPLEEYKAKYRPKHYLDIPEHLLINYSVMDAIVTFKLYMYALKNLVPKQPNVYKAYKDYVIPVIPVFLKMELNGMIIDRDYLNQYHQNLVSQIVELEQQIKEELGGDVLISSPEQIGIALKAKGLPPSSGLTKKGFYKTGVEELERWEKQGHKVATLLLRHRALQKLDNTFVGGSSSETDLFGNESVDNESGILKYIQSDGKVHSTFMPAITSSFRASSSDPNAQNYLKHGEEGKAFRKIFKCPEGFKIAEADYSGFQLRIAAILSGDPVMKDIFLNRGGDMHSVNACAVFARDVTVDEFLEKYRAGDKHYDELRYKAKNQFSFPLLFSSSPYVIYNTIEKEWSDEELQKYIDENQLELSEKGTMKEKMVGAVITDIFNKYFDTYSVLQEWIFKQHDIACDQGYTDSLHGCRRHLPRLLHVGKDLTSEEKAKVTNLKNIAVNSQVQSFEAIEAYKSLVKIDRGMVEQDVKTLLVGMVHDSQVYYFSDDEIEKMYTIIMDGMQTKEYSIPIEAEIKLGDIWGFGNELLNKPCPICGELMVKNKKEMMCLFCKGV